MTTDSLRLTAVVDPLSQVLRGLTEPCPLRSALEASGRPGVWSGPAADHFRGWLQALEVFVIRQLAPAVDDVRKWLVHRAGELEDSERSVAAGAAGAAPLLPATMGLPGPGGVPGYEPYRGPVSGFVGLDPGGLRLVATCLKGAAQSIEWHGRFAEERMAEVEGLVPADWRAALGRHSFADTAGWLTTVARELSDRARRTEEAYAVGALFGSAVPTLERLAARAASSAAAGEPLVTKGGAPAPPAEMAEPPAVAEGRAAYERAKELEAARAAGNDSVNEELMAISDRVAFDADFKAGYMEGYDRDARAAGAAGAAQLAEALNQPGCADRDFDRLAGILEARQLSDAYAAGFVETLGPRGLERFAARVKECWPAESMRLADADNRLYGPLGFMLAAASRRPGFDLSIVSELTNGFPEDWERLFQHGAFSTEVSLLVARRLIPEDHWYGFAERDRAGTGLLVLSRNPEAAHLYATAHPDVLTRHAEAPWQGTALAVGTEGFSLTDLAGFVLRIGLLDYPRSLAALPPGGGAGAELVGLTEQAATAAGEARNAATRAMNRIVAQVGDGAKLSHDGRFALAALFADRIPALAAALRTGAPVDLDAQAAPGEEQRVEPQIEDVQDCLNQIVADTDARLVLLAGLDEGITKWAQGLATQVGDHFAAHPGQSPVTAVPEVASRDDFVASGKDLGELLSQVAVALRQQVKDAKERAAHVRDTGAVDPPPGRGPRVAWSSRLVRGVASRSALREARKGLASYV